RLGSAVHNIVFDRGRMDVPALSPTNYRSFMERSAGPTVKLVESLSATNPARLEEFRREAEALVAEYFTDNTVRPDYLLTRATKIYSLPTESHGHASRPPQRSGALRSP